MDNIVGIVTIIVGICGIAGFVLSIINANKQAKVEEMHAKDRAEEKEIHAKERAEEKEMHAQELERQKQELEIQKQEKARNDRLMFLADRIFDSSIPRELRQPFYEEYISMKGNGTAVRFWQLEGERERREGTAKPC
jgi:regulator of protease activity HflC (stomatin/prohibitin superfamily)